MEQVLGQSNLFFLPLLALLPFFFLLILNYIKSPTLPPGPFSWPIIGHLLSMGTKPHVSLAQLAHTYGPIISLRLGTQLLVIGSSPSAAIEILKSHDRLLSARTIPDALPTKDPANIKFSLAWADCTDQWKYLRTICRSELFSIKAIQSQSKLREEKVIELVKFLGTKDGQLVRIDEVVFDTVVNMLSNIMVSQDFVNMEERDNEQGLRGLARKYVELALTPNIADFYPILSVLDLLGLKKISKELFMKICDLWGVMIKERREGETGNKDFLDFLLANGFTNDQINCLLFELFTAGSDTTTSTIEWVMAELMKNEEAMKNVLTELEKEIHTNTVKESDLPQLPYLHACVKETLRLHPPVPLLIPHRALETCMVMNYTIPKGTQVLVNIWDIGRDPMVWDDPLAFKPERFLDSNSLDMNLSDFGFLPFGAGRRICPGLQMATKQVHLILASLINCFHWSLPDDMHPSELNMEEKFGVSLQKEQPLILIPRVKT